MNSLTTTFFQLLADNLSGRPDKTALVDPGREIGYAELAAEVDRVAAYLLDAGVRRGDRVLVRLRKSIEEVVAMFAVSKIGAVVVNINAQWTLEQLAYVAEDCGATALITDGRTAKVLAAHGIPEPLQRVLVHGKVPDGADFDSWQALSTSGAPEAPVLETDLAMIIYTSGSTGQPKGVMLSHRNIVAGARSVARYLRLGDDERLLSILAYNFDAGLNQLTTMMLTGGTVVHQPVTMPTEIVRTLVEQEITGLAGVPPLLNPIARLLDSSPVPLPALRRVTNTGGSIPPNVLKIMKKAFDRADIYLMYGLTEAFRSTFLDPAKFDAKMGSMGQAIPGAEIYVIKHGEGLAGPGEEGELVHRGPLVSLGYWGRPELSAQKIKPCPELAHLIGDEKVVYSGDAVRVDADGDLWFVGRHDAMIKTSGIRLSPDEVENIVHRSGIVGDVVAFGVDDEDLGQAVHIAVTPLGGFDRDELMHYCRRHMASYMVPKDIRVWEDAMPRTASGKLDRPRIIRQSRPSKD